MIASMDIEPDIEIKINFEYILNGLKYNKDYFFNDIVQFVTDLPKIMQFIDINIKELDDEFKKMSFSVKGCNDYNKLKKIYTHILLLQKIHNHEYRQFQDYLQDYKNFEKEAEKLMVEKLLLTEISCLG